MGSNRTDLAMEHSVCRSSSPQGISVKTEKKGPIETTLVHVLSDEGAQLLGKPQGLYWTLTHPRLPMLSSEERIPLSGIIAGELKAMLPDTGDVLVLGLGNRHMTADALGDRVVNAVLVTRHLKKTGLRSVCALSPGVLGVTGIETAEMALSLVSQLKPSAVIVVDALAAMETSHICTTVQLTDTGIQPGSGVGNHRTAITKATLGIPVIALGIPMVVYASTIVRDALKGLLVKETNEEHALELAQTLACGISGEMVVTPRDIDVLVAGLADMLALSINKALQSQYSMDELTHLLH